MKISFRFWLIALSWLVLAGAARAQGTALTYQGRFNSGGTNLTGLYDFTFALFNASSAGAQAGSTLNSPATPVTNGLFTATLDFGNQFPGAGRWLEITVRTNGGGAFTTLSPRQRLTATPYAITASNITGLVPAASLAGTYSSVVTLNNAGNTFTGNGAGLTSLNANNLASGTVPDARLASNIARTNQVWQLAGNLGTTPGTDFLGTRDNQAVEIKVNNTRALRLEPNANGAPNVIGGSLRNEVAPGVVGATIAGGGATTTIYGPTTNRVRADFGVVSGGGGNEVGTNSTHATIGGGFANLILSNSTMSTVGGGQRNLAWGFFSTVSGGDENRATNGSATVGGGQRNVAGGSYATVGGGVNNRAGSGAVVGGGEGNLANGFRGTVGGGSFNTNTDDHAVIAGGYQNLSTGFRSVIGGGEFNVSRGDFTTVAGGAANTSTNNAATVGGGFNNRSRAAFATVAGGNQNISSDTGATVGGGENNYSLGRDTTVGGGFGNTSTGFAATVSGGYANTAEGEYSSVSGGTWNLSSGDYSVVAGGEDNISADAYTTVGGGYRNTSSNLAATISGGRQNFSSGLFSTVGGGLENTNRGSFATVPGGYLNRADGAYSFAAGRRAKADHQGAFVWADSQDLDFASTGGDRFLVRAAGGVGIGTTNLTGALYIRQPTGIPANGMAAADNGLALGQYLPSSYKWIQSYGGSLILNPLQNNVGIGLTNPASALHVNGTVTATAFNPPSDRNLKENFTGVSPREVLEKVSALRITRWNFKGDAATPHVGPMAQDFHAAFGLGTDERHIATVDADGVALAAIQGLNQKVESEKQKAEIERQALRAENSELKARLEKLERLLSEKSGGAR